MAAHGPSPATSARCEPASPMRGISGTSTARRGWNRACAARPRDVPREARHPGQTRAPARAPGSGDPPLVGAGSALARDAARLAKADLITGMVRRGAPELQGVMGRYYALHD